MLKRRTYDFCSTILLVCYENLEHPLKHSAYKHNLFYFSFKVLFIHFRYSIERMPEALGAPKF